jgi:hypothetical protein
VVQVTVPTKQHGLISMTENLRGNANTNAIPQQRCGYPMSDVMHSQIWTPQHVRHAAPLLSIANGRNAIPASEDQSIRRADSQCRFQPFSQCQRFWRKKKCSRITILGSGHDKFATC